MKIIKGDFYKEIQQDKFNCKADTIFTGIVIICIALSFVFGV